MLKRYQVLLEHWMADHVKDMAERYDMSFSEMLRCVLSIKIIELVEINCPKYKSNVNKKNLENSVKLGNLDKMDREKFHRALSKVYFETQKAIEYFYEQECKKAKKEKA
ncbi:MAG: hypothetical protein JW869_01890 [Candidatus Omnitrophica bacterium]|nr:hypothetical protein [Candidatus Omnitrophota bacterium]